MKVYNTIEELKADVVDDCLVVDDDITIKFNLDEPKLNISAWDIKAWDINAGDIRANNIRAKDIKARDIRAGDINAGDINAGDINANNINAGDIRAWNIKAKDISYYAVCFVHKNCICKSIKGRRENSRHFSLDGVILIKD